MPIVGFAMITFGWCSALHTAALLPSLHLSSPLSFYFSPSLLARVAQIVFGLWDENELDPAYSVIMILIPSTSSTLFRQRFVFTVVFQFALLCLFVTITYACDRFHSTNDLVLTALGLFFANCLFAVHAYRREYKLRKDYLMKRQLEREEVRSQNLLMRMLPASVITKLREGSDFIYYKVSSSNERMALGQVRCSLPLLICLACAVSSCRRSTSA